MSPFYPGVAHTENIKRVTCNRNGILYKRIFTQKNALTGLILPLSHSLLDVSTRVKDTIYKCQIFVKSKREHDEQPPKSNALGRIAREKKTTQAVGQTCGSTDAEER